MIIFAGLIAYLIYFDSAKSETFINSPYNTRQDTFSDRVVRGEILSSDGAILARTDVYVGGTADSVHSYANVFFHVTGYATHDES